MEQQFTPDEWMEALDKFMKHAQALVDAGYPKETHNLYTTGKSKKYLKVVQDCSTPGGRQGKEAYCFIEFSTGNVLKAETWSRPHPRPRGNIFTPDNYGVEWYGAKYISR